MNGTRGLVIATLTAFIVGCSTGLIAGIVLVRVLGPRPPVGIERPFPRGPRGPQGPEGPMMRMLSRRLDFTLEQRERIEEILDQARLEHEAVRESTRAAIERELTARQKDGWERLELRLRRGPRGEMPPPPGPEPR